MPLDRVRVRKSAAGRQGQRVRSEKSRMVLAYQKRQLSVHLPYSAILLTFVVIVVNVHSTTLKSQLVSE